MYTEDNISTIRRVRKKRRKRRGLLLLFLPLLVLLPLGYFYISSRPLISYDFYGRFNIFYYKNQQISNSDGFAKDIAIVRGDTGDTEDFAPSAGLLCKADGGEALFAKNAFQKMYPASTTKIMTALLAIKYGNPDDEVIVGPEIEINEEKTSMAGLAKGDRLTLEQLLYALLLPSGNDAANAIAVHISGDVDSFVKKMNEEAKSLLATGTHFTNPHGLTNENHYTTAYDLYLIFKEALKYPEFRKIIGTAHYTANYKDKNGKSVSKAWVNSNLYLEESSVLPQDIEPFLNLPSEISVFGGKTGTTAAARNCLVIGSTKNEDEEYVSIVLKAAGKEALYENMTKLLNKIER